MGMNDQLAQLVARTMASQYGLITRNQARQLGMTERMVDRRVASGRWRTVHPAVYRSAESPVAIEQGLLAAVLASGPAAAISHRSAAVLHGTRRFSAHVIEVSATGGRHPRLDGVVVHR